MYLWRQTEKKKDEKCAREEGNDSRLRFTRRTEMRKKRKTRGAEFEAAK